MYVSGTASATRLPADAHLVDERALLALAQRRAVARREQLDDLGADVVARPRVLVAGIAEPDDEQVGRRSARAATAAAAALVDESSLAAVAAVGRLACALGALGAFALFALDSPSTSSSTTTRGAATWATTVVGLELGGDARRGSAMSATWSWSPIVERRDVDLDRRPGCCPGMRLDREREDELLEQAAVLHARGLADRGGAGPRRSTATSRRMRMKSTCTSSPRVGWRWIWRASVSTLVAVDLEGDQRVGAGSRRRGCAAARGRAR